MLVAATVLAPLIVICMRGESAIGSLNVAVIRREVPLLTGPVGEYVIAAVGAVGSQVTLLSVEVETLLLLPATSVTAFAAIDAMTVPAVVIPDTAILNVVPLFGAISVIATVFVP